MLNKFGTEILPSSQEQERERELEFFSQKQQIYSIRDTQPRRWCASSSLNIYISGASLFFPLHSFGCLKCFYIARANIIAAAHTKPTQIEWKDLSLFIPISLWYHDSKAAQQKSRTSVERVEWDKHRQKNVNNNSRGFAKKRAKEATPKFIHEKISLFSVWCNFTFMPLLFKNNKWDFHLLCSWRYANAFSAHPSPAHIKFV